MESGMLKTNSLKGQTFIVTGGGTGLGKSMTRYFLELGAKVLITSRKIEILEKTRDEFKQFGMDNILPLQADVRDSAEVKNVLNKGIELLGPVTGLVNNAAGNFISPTERLSPRAFDAVIDIVLKGTVNWTLAVGKHWIKHNQPGTVLNIVTTYAWTGSGFVVPSACAKAGVLALTRSLAVEWAKYRIRTNAIAPGPFPTEGAWSRLLPGELAKKLDPAQKVPVGRVGEHQELANLAAYLMSPFSAFVNGEVVTIDGGEWLKGAGEFNHMEQVTPEMWDTLENLRSKG